MPGSMGEQQWAGRELQELLGDAPNQQIVPSTLSAAAGAEQIDSGVRGEREKSGRRLTVGGVELDPFQVEARSQREVGEGALRETLFAIAQAREEELCVGEQRADSSEGGAAAARTVGADQNATRRAGTYRSAYHDDRDSGLPRHLAARRTDEQSPRPPAVLADHDDRRSKSIRQLDQRIGREPAANVDLDRDPDRGELGPDGFELLPNIELGAGEDLFRRELQGVHRDSGQSHRMGQMENRSWSCERHVPSPAGSPTTVFQAVKPDHEVVQGGFGHEGISENMVAERAFLGYDPRQRILSNRDRLKRPQPCTREAQMDQKRLWSTLLAVLALIVAPAMAQQDAQPPAEDPQDLLVEEVMVVTASRTEQALNEAPAAISVLTAKDIESIPADNYGALLRNVPGLNVSQTSARDINMTARGSTNTLSTSQLVLLDGRSLYLDFFGFVMWDFLPVNTAEIKQIEAVRGPGSAVWGANAMTGVVNLITKRPKEMVGTSILLGAGEIGTAYGSITHAGVSGNFGYKVSGGYYEQDAYERPVIPGVRNFANSGTAQPKGDLRFDWDLADDSVFSAGAGYAGTDGIIHTGIGPFDIQKGSDLSYAKLDWNKSALLVSLFANFLSADSSNLVSVGRDGRPLGFQFSTDTYNLDASNTTVAGSHNIFTYGASYRDSKFDLEIAPRGTKKKEWGVFLQDEILLGDKVRWIIGARYDDIAPIDPVVTPRTSLLFAPNTHHTFRISYNEAFRTPSVINQYLDATILVGAAPLLLPATADGNVALVEEQLTAYEIGYVGSFDNGVTLTLAAYHNVTEDSIDFYTSRFYGPGNLPLGLIPPPLPPSLAFCFLLPPTAGPVPPPFANCPGPIPGTRGLAGVFPSDFSYRNIGETTDQGVELTLQQRIGTDWSWFANASWQDDPKFKGIADAAISQNRAPEWRANLGVSYDSGSFFVNTNVNYQDEAYWADVPLAVGKTEAFTAVNLAVGFRLLDERMTLQVIGSNVFDEEIQQHYFGDIISRKITGQVGFRF